MASKPGSMTITKGDRLEFATFHVDDLLVGIEISHVQEINRQLDLTIVPGAPTPVRGVVNLRGDVVTVLDLRTILGLKQTRLTEHSRNVVVNADGERIGVLVDRVADVVMASAEDLEPPPANICGARGRFFEALCKLDTKLLAILDLGAAVQVGGEEQNELAASGDVPAGRGAKAAQGAGPHAAKA